MAKKRIIFKTYVGRRELECCTLSGDTTSEELKKGLGAKLQNVVWGEATPKNFFSDRETELNKALSQYLAHSEYATSREKDFRGNYKVVIKVNNIKK